MYHLAMRAVVEGPTDEPFFGGLLPRALDQICLDVVPPPVLIDVSTWRPHVMGAESRHDSVLRGVRDIFPWVDVVFLHVDGTTKPERELAKYFAPVQVRWAQVLHEAERKRLLLLLPLVPVREMEAWAMADHGALRQLVRRDWRDEEIYEGDRLPDVERLSDPKRTLDNLMALAPRSRNGREAADYLLSCGAHLARGLWHTYRPFVSWQRDTRASLRQLLTDR